jgi:hypothetical protein
VYVICINAVRDALSRGEVVTGPAARESDGRAKPKRGESHKSGAAVETRVMRERMGREEVKVSLGVYGLNIELRVKFHFELHPTIHINRVTSDLDCIYS